MSTCVHSPWIGRCAPFTPEGIGVTTARPSRRGRGRCRSRSYRPITSLSSRTCGSTGSGSPSRCTTKTAWTALSSACTRRKSGSRPFSDRALRQYIREFKEYGFDVYLTLAFESFEAETAQRPVNRGQLGRPAVPDYGPTIRPENWPWLPNHTDHTRFVREFWSTYTDQAVHYAKIAQAEGVGMYSLGTETDSLFRSRSGGDFWVNDFGDELRTLVESVRAEYDGLLTYTMLYLTTIGDWFDPGSKYLWEDLDLDVVGVSGYYPLAEPPLDTVMSVDVAAVVQPRLSRPPPAPGGREHRSTDRLHRIRIHGYR